jgi:hypothetical protein
MRVRAASNVTSCLALILRQDVDRTEDDWEASSKARYVVAPYRDVIQSSDHVLPDIKSLVTRIAPTEMKAA